MLKTASECFIHALLLFLGLFLKISRWVPLNLCEQWLTTTRPLSFPGCDCRCRGKVERTTKANFLCQGSWSSWKLLKLYLQFSSSLLLHKGSKMLCAVDVIFHLLCAFNCLQPISRVALGTRMNISGKCFAMVTYKGPETKSPLTRLKCPFIVFV